MPGRWWPSVANCRRRSEPVCWPTQHGRPGTPATSRPPPATASPPSRSAATSSRQDLLDPRNLAFVAGDHAQAVEHFRRAILGAVSQRAPRSEAMATGMLALVRAELGEEAEARRLVTEAIGLAERLGEPTILAVTYDTVAAALARIGSATEAIAMWEQDSSISTWPGRSWPATTDRRTRSGSTTPTRRPVSSASPSPSPKSNSPASIRRSHCSRRPPSPPRTGRERIAAQLLGAFNHHGEGWRR